MELYHTAYGPEDAPRLLVLHGGPGASHDYLLPQMLELASDYRLIFYDQRGGGRSRAEDRSPITWQTHVQDLASLVRELSLEPLTIVGYSWGGLLALLYSIAATGGFRDQGIELSAESRELPILRAWCSSAQLPPPPGFARSSVRSSRAASAPHGSRRSAQRSPHRDSRERDPAAYAKRIFELGVAGYFADPARARELTPFRVVGRVQQSVWESLAGYDLTPQLPLIEAPTLVLHGAHDAIPLASLQLIASSVAHGELVVLDESAHVPYVEGQAAFFAAVREFLQRTRAQS